MSPSRCAASIQATMRPPTRSSSSMYCASAVSTSVRAESREGSVGMRPFICMSTAQRSRPSEAVEAPRARVGVEAVEFLQRALLQPAHRGGRQFLLRGEIAVVPHARDGRALRHVLEAHRLVALLGEQLDRHVDDGIVAQAPHRVVERSGGARGGAWSVCVTLHASLCDTRCIDAMRATPASMPGAQCHAARVFHREEDAAGQQAAGHAQLMAAGTLPSKSQSPRKIFAPMKISTRASAYFRVVEAVHHRGEREIERTQAEDGEDVAGVDDERIRRDRRSPAPSRSRRPGRRSRPGSGTAAAWRNKARPLPLRGSARRTVKAPPLQFRR